MQEELQAANDQLSQYRTQPPPVSGRKSPAPPAPPSTRTEEPSVQPRPPRLLPTTEIVLPEYCPRLVERLKDNPKFLTKFRDDAKRQFVEELEEFENLGISEVKSNEEKYEIQFLLLLLDRYTFNRSGFSNKNGSGFTNSTKYSKRTFISSRSSIYSVLVGFT